MVRLIAHRTASSRSQPGLRPNLDEERLWRIELRRTTEGAGIEILQVGKRPRLRHRRQPQMGGGSSCRTTSICIRREGSHT